MAESGFIRVPRTTNLLVSLVHAAILKMPGVLAIDGTPHFEFKLESRERRPIEPVDEPPFYELVVDRYLIAAEAAVSVSIPSTREGRENWTRRTIELKLVAERCDGSDPGWGNIWTVDAWWRGVRFTEKPGKARWLCGEEKWDFSDCSVKNQSNFPPPELHFSERHSDFKIRRRRVA